jgi:NOL1/NOP2/sun family putative RNA methylase
MLDEKFKERMKRLLPDEYDAFITALEEGEAVRAVRVNTLKTDIEQFLSKTSISLSPLSYSHDGFLLSDGGGIGNTPEHHAGMIYVQDPGAMASLCALDIQPNWRILDTCAAPGGKSGQAAARLGDEGFLLSNEFVPKRAKILVSNFERLGIRNAIVTSLDTGELSRLFSAFFNLVIVDAPCSGEGMFRKSDEALSEWSEENVIACAKRQEEILDNAAATVMPGGYLLYSTCTYSTEENEGTLDAFLTRHGDFSLSPVKDELLAVTAPGITPMGSQRDFSHARRFYPHKSPGEGQFVALLKRDENIGVMPTILYKDAAKLLTKTEMEAVEKFFREALTEPPKGKILRCGDNIVLAGHGMPIPPRSVFSAGVLLGEIRGGMLFPSHQFFSAYGRLFKRQEMLSAEDSRVQKYLAGEEIEARSFDGGGFCAVLYEGAPLGGGKASGGRIKNHYPKGLRLR